MIGLAGAFGRQVVAEGLETLEHGTLLMALGCDLAQGYCISRPMPAAQVIDWAAGYRQPREWRDQAGQ